MPKRMLQGVVLSDKQDKTVIVSVERRFTHPVLKKTIRRSKTFHAHDEKNEYSVGDMVWIEEHSPISKLKRWMVVRGEKSKKTEALVGDVVDAGAASGKKSRKISAKAK